MILPRYSIRLAGCFLTLLLCANPILLFAARKAAVPAPALAVDMTHFEIGALVEGDPVLHAIPYTNTGDADLVIQRVKTDCACTTVMVDKVLPPGGRGKIELTIDTADHRGSVERKIALHTNDPERPVTVLKLALEVTPAISVTPDRVFLDGFVGETVQTLLTFTANRELPLDLRIDTVSLDDSVKHELQTIEPGRKHRLAVAHTPKTPGTLRGRLIFSTGYPMHPRITVPVLCRTRNPVEAVPDRIDFGTLQRARYFHKSATGSTKPTGRPLPTRSCMLRLNRGEELHLTEVKIPPDQFESRWEAVVPGSLYRVILTPRLAELPSGPLETALTLTTDPNDPRRIKVPVSVHVK